MATVSEDDVAARWTAADVVEVTPLHPDGSPVVPPPLADDPAHALDPSTTAVVVVDVQRLFTDLLGVPVDPPLDGMLAATSDFLREARAAGATVVLARTVMAPEDHSRNTAHWPDAMRLNLLPGSTGTDFDPAAAPRPGDVGIVKQRYSAFLGTSLDETLRDRGLTTVVVLGMTTNVCVQSTARDAWQYDYDTITPSDCCSEVGQGSHEASLVWTGRNFGRVRTSAQVLSAWRAHV